MICELSFLEAHLGLTVSLLVDAIGFFPEASRKPVSLAASDDRPVQPKSAGPHLS